MRNRWVLVGLLVVATVLVDLVVWSIVLSKSEPGRPPPALVEVAEIVLWLLAFAQVSLVAVWVGFAGTSLPWRLVGLIIVIALWAALEAMTRGPAGPFHTSFQTYGTVSLLAQAITVLGPLVIARLAGVRLGTTTDVLSPPEAPGNRRRWQFSLGYLFSWLTVVAVTLGLLNWTIDYHQVVPLTFLLWEETMALSLAGAAIALPAVWTALGTGRPAWRLGLLCVTTLTAMAIYTLWIEVDPWPDAILVCFVQVLWLLASLGVCRVAGYRIAFRRPAGS